MNQLLLLGLVVVALYLVNQKDVVSKVSKSLKSVASGNNTTLLVLLFCGVILFLCMRKKVTEGMAEPGEPILVEGVQPDENGDCSSSKHPHTHQLYHINNLDTPLTVCVSSDTHNSVKSLMIKNNQENPPTREDDANARGNRQTDRRSPGMIDPENPLDMEPDDMDTGDMGPDDMDTDDMDTGDMDPDDMGECQYTDQQLNDEISRLNIEVPGDTMETKANIKSGGATIDGTVISDIEKFLRQLSGKMEGANGEYSGCAYPLDVRDQKTITQYAKLSFESNNNK